MAGLCETHCARALFRVVRGVRRCALTALLVVGACSGESVDSPEDTGSESTELRTVSLVPSLAELTIALGAGDYLVARTDYDTHPTLMELPSIGGGLDPNLETLVGLGATVVLIAEGRDTPGLQERLSSVGIRGVAFQTQSVDDIYASIATLGAMYDRRESADSLRESIEGDLAAIRARVSSREPVSVFYVVWPDPPMTVGPGAFIDEVIRIAGGRNVFEDSPIEWPNVGFESIVDRSPEVVLWPQGEVNARNVDQLRDTPGWRDVSAVQAGRVSLVDANLFNRPGPNVVEAARVLARILHPDAH